MVLTITYWCEQQYVTLTSLIPHSNTCFDWSLIKKFGLHSKCTMGTTAYLIYISPSKVYLKLRDIVFKFTFHFNIFIRHANTMTAITFEELLNQTNGFGRYQLLVMLVTALPWGVVCFNHMGIIFLADTPNFWCSENLLRNRTLFSTNVTREVHNISGIRTRPGIKDDQCKVRVPNITAIDRSPADDFRQSHEACTRWVYDQTYYDATAVTQVRLSENDLSCID